MSTPRFDRLQDCSGPVELAERAHLGHHLALALGQVDADRCEVVGDLVAAKQLFGSSELG